ncbi:MAG: RNase P modulator RnpM [Thermomicrobiales bacterium]
MAATPTQKETRPQKGQRPKHVPQRMCVVCRERSAKRTLHRVVRTPEGGVLLDPTGKMNGRGAYLCDDPACWDRALSSGQLARALKTRIDSESQDLLGRFAAHLPPAATGAAAAPHEGNEKT